MNDKQRYHLSKTDSLVCYEIPLSQLSKGVLLRRIRALRGGLFVIS